MSKLEDELAWQIKATGIEAPEREYKFARDIVGHGPGIRKRLQEKGLKDWRFDFAWPEHRFAVEVEGGAWINGRHNRGKGFEDDLVKYHHAMNDGWNVYRCSKPLISSGASIAFIQRYLWTKSG